MPLFSGLESLCRNLLQRESVDTELDEELRGYLREFIEHNVANGIDRKDAEKLAREEVGGLIQVRDAVRAGRIGVGLENIARDASHAWRALRRSPGFTVVAVL